VSGPAESEANPWTTLSSRVVYDNPWMSVRQDQVLRPDGQEGIYGVMSAKQVATGVVALTPTLEVWLVGQYRYPTDVYSWELIEGGADPSSPALEGAQRELREEAGLVAHEWHPLGGEIHLSNSITAERGYLFLARELEQVGDPEPEGTEVLQLKTVPFTEALALCERGAIQDAFSIIGLLLAERWLRARGEL
jgi:8-oxo-dGTP pyrophosphatase MutT (NUDIX family)